MSSPWKSSALAPRYPPTIQPVLTEAMVVGQFEKTACTSPVGVILSVAAFQAERRACPERSRRDLRLDRPGAYAKLHHLSY